MNARLAAIARRRAALVDEIAVQREAMAQVVVQLRTQLALAGVAMLASRLLRRSRWWRLLGVAGAVLAAAVPLFTGGAANRRSARGKA